MSEDEGMQGAGTRPTAFLSYSHADQDRVRLLADALEQAGISVWWDTLIEGGAVFAKSVEVALARCDAVIVAWSKVSVSSDWVLDEAAQGRDMRKLVPVSLDGTMPPLGFRQYLSVDLLGWRGDANASQIATIVRGVEAVAGRLNDAAAHPGKLHAPTSPPAARADAPHDAAGHGRHGAGRSVGNLRVAPRSPRWRRDHSDGQQRCGAAFQEHQRRYQPGLFL